MNHQITLEELGIIPKTKEDLEQGKTIRGNYAFPCGGCICNHCANSVECFDRCMGKRILDVLLAMSVDGVTGKGLLIIGGLAVVPIKLQMPMQSGQEGNLRL